MNIAARAAYRFGYLRSEHWANLRIAKLASVDAKCRVCHKRSLSNDVHHLNYRHLFDVRLQDLVVLCRICHGVVHEILDQCQSINATEGSETRWKRTRHIFWKKVQAHEHHKAVRKRNLAIRKFRRMRHESSGQVLRVPYRQIYKFHRLYPRANVFDWMRFTARTRMKPITRAG